MNEFTALDGSYRNFSYGNEAGTAVRPAFSHHEFSYLLNHLHVAWRGLWLCFVSELTLKSWRDHDWKHWAGFDRDVSEGGRLHYDSPQKQEIFVSQTEAQSLIHNTNTNNMVSRICNFIQFIFYYINTVIFIQIWFI